MSEKPDTTRAATDVPEFIAELDGGLFYELEMLEGHLKGQTKVTQRAPAGYQNDDQADQDERRYAEA